jgi:acyl-CoA thioester hydrolase
LKEFRFPIRVYYEDTDAGGVVYYANYLKFMERARTEWLRSLGFEQDELRESAGILFAVARVEVDYLRPARFNDALTVMARVVQAGRASIEFEQTVELDANAELLCRGRVKVVCIDAERFRPKPMPKSVQEQLTGVL